MVLLVVASGGISRSGGAVVRWGSGGVVSGSGGCDII